MNFYEFNVAFICFCFPFSFVINKCALLDPELSLWNGPATWPNQTHGLQTDSLITFLQHGCKYDVPKSTIDYLFDSSFYFIISNYQTNRCSQLLMLHKLNRIILPFPENVSSPPLSHAALYAVLFKFHASFVPVYFLGSCLCGVLLFDACSATKLWHRNCTFLVHSKSKMSMIFLNQCSPFTDWKRNTSPEWNISLCLFLLVCIYKYINAFQTVSNSTKNGKELNDICVRCQMYTVSAI